MQAKSFLWVCGIVCLDRRGIRDRIVAVCERLWLLSQDYKGAIDVGELDAFTTRLIVFEKDYYPKSSWALLT
jgi:hypothetical protein